MGINFERNSYLSAVKEKAHLNSENIIFNYAKASLQFKYVDVSVQEFNQKYSAKGLFGRKVAALPAAIWSGVIKTIYHLAKAILGVIARSGDNKYLKAQFFYIARDLQESFGWLATLINDRYGQYHIQESGFHKSCYDCFATNTTLRASDLSSTDKRSSWGYSKEDSSKYDVMDDGASSGSSNVVRKHSETQQRISRGEAKSKSDFQALEEYIRANTRREATNQPHSESFTNRGSQPSDKQSVINRVGYS